MNHLSPFDPEILPIRSCIRPVDELVSNYGPNEQKVVTFDPEVTIIDAFSRDAIEFPPIPRTRRIKRNMNNSSVGEPPSGCRYDHVPKPNQVPVFSSFRKPDPQRKVMNVRFAFAQTNILPDGRTYDSATTIENLADFWKPGAMDSFPVYKLNCNKI